MIEKILMYDGPLQKIVPDENKNFEQIIFLDGKFGWTINQLKIKEFHQRKQKYWCISNVENIWTALDYPKFCSVLYKITDDGKWAYNLVEAVKKDKKGTSRESLEDIKDIVDKFQIMSEDLDYDPESVSSFEQICSLLGFSKKDIKKMKDYEYIHKTKR